MRLTAGEFAIAALAVPKKAKVGVALALIVVVTLASCRIQIVRGHREPP